MKKVILASLLCFFSLLSQAQIVENLEYPSFHFGIRGAYTSNRAFFSGDGTSDSKIFGSLGLAMDFRIASIPLYLETGWYYMNKDGRVLKIVIMMEDMIQTTIQL